jgi:hypothetical protein
MCAYYTSQSVNVGMVHRSDALIAIAAELRQASVCALIL